ncbi:MAG TPA: phosphatidate cytidylyltransferase [Acidimicrobiales bacterium]|nr:phosphatidate cytidylyltransferase [Acidimicrobiales bacterium]
MDNRDDFDDFDEFDDADILSQPPRPPGEGVRIVGAEEASARLESGEASRRRGEDEPGYLDVPASPDPSQRTPFRFPRPDHGASSDDSARRPVTAVDSTTELPHWTDPPTGEVPRILAGDDPVDDGVDEDLGAWAGLANRAPHWRDQQADWDEPDYDDLSALADGEVRVGTLDPTRSEESDMFSFDDPEPDPDPEPARGPVLVDSSTTGPRAARNRPVAPPFDHGEVGLSGGGGRDMGTAIGVGIVLAAIALFLFSRGPAASMIIVTAVITLAAAEAFAVFRKAGHRPATLLGLVATLALILTAYSTGERAVPLVLFLSVVMCLVWYLAGATRGRPTINVALTLFGIMWIGFLGSFAALLLRFPNRNGVAFLLGAILCTVANDVGALFIGMQMGGSQMAPTISPNKTWSGFVGGFFASVFVGAVLVQTISPWNVSSGLLLGVVVALVGPLGDLCESMVKRDLGLKDMGSILPGHGGVLDRFDAMLFVLPAVYYLVQLLDLGP